MFQCTIIIDDLNDEDNEVTWGNKMARYLYTYTLQSPDLISNISDSETESIYSIQSKSTSNNFKKMLFITKI